MGTLSVIIVGALIISLIMATLRKLYDFLFGSRLSPNVPRPPPYPFLRHLPYFLNSFDYEKKLHRWAETYKQAGLFMFDALLGQERVCVIREDFVKQILVTKSKIYAKTKILLGVFPKTEKGVFMANGKEHAWQRKMLNPSFSLSSILLFVEAFDSNTNNLIKHWNDKTKASLSGVAEVELLKDFSKLTIDVIGETAFGQNFNTLVSGENEVSHAVDFILSGKISVLARLLRRYIPFYDMIPFPENVKLKQAAEVTNNMVNGIIKKKREMMKNGTNQNKDMSKDLLGKMILLQDEDTGERLSDEVIESQVHTFMVAGYETTSVALTWTIYLLAKHPAVQEKARAEAKAVLSDSDEFQGKHLESIQYISAVIKESLRLYSPGTVLMRKALEDDQLGEYKIPKGTCILIPLCAVHRMEEYWPNHDQFIPERFLSADDKQPDIGNYKFMPFSNGPYNCIGKRFALTELKVAVTKLLTKFKFEVDPKQEEMRTIQQLTLKPHPKAVVRLSRIET